MKKTNTTQLPLSELVIDVNKIAETAGQEILKIYESDFSISHKDDRTPLTTADMASHNCICQKLALLTPDIPVLSEESSDIPYSTRKSWQQYWLVDPLDGTREFIKRNGEFTVNIALVENHRSVLGVINVPVSGVTYYASNKHGAFMQTNGETPHKIKTRKTSPEKFVVAGSRSHASEKQHAFTKSLGDVEIISIGSSLKFCLVAEGKVDIYPRFGPTSEWDTAAAQCIVEEAGGMVTDTDMNALAYNKKESLINPDFLVIADRSFDWQAYLKK